LPGLLAREKAVRQLVPGVLVLLVVGMGLGCSGQKSVHDRITGGMTRDTVVRMLGEPTDSATSMMHWQFGRYRDAWVFFDDSGSRVTGKYWQDEETLPFGGVQGRRQP
jgi:hypothetical protein